MPSRSNRIYIMFQSMQILVTDTQIKTQIDKILIFKQNQLKLYFMSMGSCSPVLELQQTVVVVVVVVSPPRAGKLVRLARSPLNWPFRLIHAYYYFHRTKVARLKIFWNEEKISSHALRCHNIVLPQDSISKVQRFLGANHLIKTNKKKRKIYGNCDLFVVIFVAISVM